MVQRSVDDHLEEAESLDWKEYLPQPPCPDLWCEFAKDVAAMANSAGGLLVYGVKDKPIQMMGIDPSQVNEKQYRSWAHTYIQPLVSGLYLEVLSAADGSKSVLVAHVPASEEAPHLVTGTAQKDKDQRAFFVPYRDHDETRWMGEAQLARA